MRSQRPCVPPLLVVHAAGMSEVLIPLVRGLGRGQKISKYGKSGHQHVCACRLLWFAAWCSGLKVESAVAQAAVPGYVWPVLAAEMDLVPGLLCQLWAQQLPAQGWRGGLNGAGASASAVSQSSLIPFSTWSNKTLLAGTGKWWCQLPLPLPPTSHPGLFGTKETWLCPPAS